MWKDPIKLVTADSFNQSNSLFWQILGLINLTKPQKRTSICTENTMFWLVNMRIVCWRAGQGAPMCDRVPIIPLASAASTLMVINSGSSSRNCGHNSGSGPLPLPLWGSVLNFVTWNFAAAIMNSRMILRPQLHVAGRNSVEAKNPNQPSPLQLTTPTQTHSHIECSLQV
jgi:hypothetical protein